jgi:sulfur relay (sulfurtransferase) DsrC/TusE family protein
MTINPFAVKPKVDHSKIIRHFLAEFSELKSDKDELGKDIDAYMKETVDYKLEITESINKIKENTPSSNRKLADEYDTVTQGMRERHDAFKTDTETITQSITVLIQKAEKSKDSMQKEELKKF